ncbi:hypothetical protein Ancab_012711 [Ancistrocladus abbreviatus]
MSATKFTFLGSTIMRNPRSFYSFSSPSLTKPLIPRPIFYLHKPYASFVSSSSAATIQVLTDSNEACSPQEQKRHHPWPEWVTFVDRLKSKGYITETKLSGNDNGTSIDHANSCGPDAGLVYEDMNILKDACLSFARDRFDIFKSLSTDDIQAIVRDGCPNLFRKVVNSAKRLRAYVRLDEGDVCGACTLRGSCDRAYVMLKESEGAARTVDIMRILLFYVLDPSVVSVGVKPPGREQTESSARRLLSEFLELCEEPPDAAVPEPAVEASFQKERIINLVDSKSSQNADMKKGDWMCPKCNFLNFARNNRCLNCNEDGPRKVSIQEVEVKNGDWICPGCNFVNFSRNIRCLKCKVEGPKRVVTNDVQMKKGDWNCLQCGFMNFARNSKCLRCTEPRPPRQLKPGDWECPSCDFLNYRRNLVCLKCECEHPKTVAVQYEDQFWRKPQ